MTSTAAQVQFAAEFVTFLVAAAGLALVVLRNELTATRPPERLALTIGFLATALAAFGHGSLLLKNYEGIVIALRVAGIVGLAIGSSMWQGERHVARNVLWSGLLGWAAASALEAAGTGQASNAALAAGSILAGAALLIASRRSVAARVAASAAGTLLLVVLVLAVALSAVLSSSVEREELNRLQSRANTEANLATTSFQGEIPVAHLAGTFFFTQGGLTNRQVQEILAGLHGVYPVGGFEILVPTSPANPTNPAGPGSTGGVTGAGRIVGTVNVDQTIATTLAGEPFAQADCNSLSGNGSLYIIGSKVLSAAAWTLCPQQTNGAIVPVGIMVRVRPLDDAYLSSRHNDDDTVSLAIVDQSGVLSRAGPLPAIGTLRSIGSSVVSSNAAITRIVGGQYVAAQPIKQSTNQPIGALVVSTPTSAVVATRDRLFRTLFLIALGGTLIALGLAVVVGDRITAGLRRLTLVAESIQRGRRERAGITTEDEVGVLGAAFDSMADSIEEQTRALRAAADDETRLRSRLEAVVAGMRDALVAVDAAGRITDFNQAAEEMTGVAAAAAISKPVAEVVRLVNEDGASLGPRLSLPSPARWGLIATAVDFKGTEFPVAVSTGALRGPGNELVGQVLVLRDLRREREVERMKTEFLSRVGHELRTPLTGIMGYVDFLSRKSVPAERAQLYYEDILASAKRLLRVVEMLEFFASSGAGRVLLRPEPLDVGLLIESVVAPWTERLTGPNNITWRIGREVPPEINGDRRWLALAIDELIDNAVKFSVGGAQVTVTANVGTSRPPSASGLYPVFTSPVLEISVMDRGKGMTPEEQASAFNEFVQGDSSDTRQFGGLGLGLSLVQRVVEGHGGAVRCSSFPGRGSTFTIVLPFPPRIEHDLPVPADDETRPVRTETTAS